MPGKKRRLDASKVAEKFTGCGVQLKCNDGVYRMGKCRGVDQINDDRTELRILVRGEIFCGDYRDAVITKPAPPKD